MRPADEGAADRREAAGREPLAEVRRQAAPHDVVEPDLDLVVRREGRRRARVEDRARTGQHLERPEMARVRGGVRAGDVHEDHLCGDHRPVARRVVRTRILIGVVAQVDDERVVGDLERDAVDGTRVLLLLEPERALRQLGERAARDLLAVVHEDAQGGRERLEPVLADQLENPPFPDARGRDARPHVALEEVWEPAVRLHDLHHRLERLSLPDELHRR